MYFDAEAGKCNVKFKNLLQKKPICVQYGTGAGFVGMSLYFLLIKQYEASQNRENKN